jgi:hypothetical protein
MGLGLCNICILGFFGLITLPPDSTNFEIDITFEFVEVKAY